MQPAGAGSVEHCEMSLPTVRTRKENLKPMKDANAPWKGFLFLQTLRRQMSAAAGRHSQKGVLTPSKEHWGSE